MGGKASLKHFLGGAVAPLCRRPCNVSFIWRFHCTGIQILIGTLACGHNREVTSLLKRKVHCNNIESVCNYGLLNQLNLLIQVATVAGISTLCM